MGDAGIPSPQQTFQAQEIRALRLNGSQRTGSVSLIPTQADAVDGEGGHQMGYRDPQISDGVGWTSGLAKAVDVQRFLLNSALPCPLMTRG